VDIDSSCLKLCGILSPEVADMLLKRFPAKRNERKQWRVESSLTEIVRV
jgi:hypothetical protein